MQLLRASSIVIFVAGGVALVLWAIAWFRTQAEARLVDTQTQDEALLALEVQANEAVNASAVLRDASGVVIGSLVRSGTVELPNYETVVQLPSIDNTTVAYGVWLLKEGLADVKYAGDLLPRADGSWALTFSIPDPLDYPQAVIMLEPKYDDPWPSGNRVAEGEFSAR